jgi:hypothetical protein
MTKTLFLILILHLPLFFCGQTEGTGKNDYFKNYSIREQQEDLKTLKASLEKIHPGLYWHITKEQFEKKYDSLYNSINSGKTAYQFLDCVFVLLANIRCTHTDTNLSEQEAEFEKNNLPHFPFEVIVIDNKLYIKNNYTADNLFEAGTQILSINGRKASDLIQKFIKRSYVDGFNSQGEIHELSSRFEILTEHEFDIPPVYSIEFVSSDGRVIKKQVSAVTGSAIKDYESKKYPPKPNESIKIMDSLKTAILTFNTFNDTSYVTFLEQSFKTIKDKNSKNLIIDLRKNPGGYDDFGSRLFAYIALTPFKYYDHLEMTIDSLNDPVFKSGHFIDSAAIKEFFNKNHLKKMANGNYILDKKQHSITADAPFSPEKNSFKGAVFVLISSQSSSGASEFSALVHFNKRATFIGQETGGGYCGNTSGFEYLLSLPNTKIRVIIPVIRYLEAIDNCVSKGGVKPDYAIAPNVNVLGSDADREMKCALDLIRNK